MELNPKYKDKIKSQNNILQTLNNNSHKPPPFKTVVDRVSLLARQDTFYITENNPHIFTISASYIHLSI